MPVLLRRILPPVAMLLLFGGALWVLHRELRGYGYHEVIGAFSAIPHARIGLALALTTMSYLVLTGYDALALRYLKKKLDYGRTALTSFVGYVFSHNLSVLGGGVAKLRLYSAWGISPVETATIVLFCGWTFWLGFFAVAGVLFCVEPLVVPGAMALPFQSTLPLGVIFIVLAGVYILWTSARRAPIRTRNWEFEVPSLRIALAQLGLSIVDWLLAGAVFVILLPDSPSIDAWGILTIFMLAQCVGMASHVPGGLGVFDGIIVLLLNHHFAPPQVVGCLIAYRVVYYLAPLAVGSLLLGYHEALQRRPAVRQFFAEFGRWIPALAPRLFAIGAFAAGAMLLVSGATPIIGSRRALLERFFPLALVEASHFFASLVGVGLLILARGLQRRLDAAYWLTLALLGGGVVLSLLRGFDYEEAVLLSVLLLGLIPCRAHFYRRAALSGGRFTVSWGLAVALVIVCSLWLGRFAHQHAEYSSQLWWHFAFKGDASRAMRASVGAVTSLLFFAGWRLMRHAPFPVPALTGADLADAKTIVANSPRSHARLALLGDKSLLFNDARTGLVMYGVEGRSWVSMGDPIGPAEAVSELAWRFYELADLHGGWAVFYEVRREHLDVYVDMGLNLLKVGEEARVPLTAFSMEGSERKALRNAVNKVERAGATFEVIPAEAVPPLLPELRLISDAWLAGKNTREKGFSLGYFDEAYLSTGPVAVIRAASGIVAFANVWPGAGGEELSVDLMRYRDDAPPGVMDYLFVQLMRWGQSQGYRHFSLGMAPLAGLENRRLSPFWNRLGSIVYRHGEHFYNFQELRQFKDKFDPTWEPRYLACPTGLILPRILTNVAALTGRGLRGVLGK